MMMARADDSNLNMITTLLLALACLATITHGVPVNGDAPSDETLPPTTTTTVSLPQVPTGPTTTPQPIPSLDPDEPEGHSMDDLMPGVGRPLAPQKPSAPSALVFVDLPRNSESEPGVSVLLACRTAEPVAECQWSWQPLTPTLPDVDDGSPALVANSAPTLTVPANEATTNTTPVPVRKFAAFGNGSNDCSVRFSSVKHEQTGYWSCAARRHNEENFTSTPPAKLGILNIDTDGRISFSQEEAVLESPAGAAAELPCRTSRPVRECHWSWRQLNQSQPWDTVMRESFPPTGNESNVCDHTLTAVKLENEGLWTCGARVLANAEFAQAQPIKLLISEVEFVQLSKGIQITAGETVFLRCLVNKPVYQCEWSWRPSNSSKNSTIVKKFEPGKETDHDCSVRFKNILYEEEGLWTCGVRLTPSGILHEAPSTTVTLLPSGKVNFTETPESTSGALGSEVTLRCSTNGRIERCAWSWRSLTATSEVEDVTLHEFPSRGDLGRNCDLVFDPLKLEDQGYWTCHAYLAGINTVMTTDSAKVTVYEEEDVSFSELSKDIQISSGGTVSLRCVTTARVEQCRWSLTPEGTVNTTVVVKLFAPPGPEARDCSVKLSHALQEQEGLWTCGARLHAKQNYTDAPPARLSLIEPEPITVTVWGMPHQTVNLACKTGLHSPDILCLWTHGQEMRFSQINSTKKMKHTVTMNYSSGVCSLQFIPDDRDFGEWNCEFRIVSTHVQSELGGASILLLNNSPDQQLSWLVGAITSTVLFLLIIIVVIVVCRTRNRKMPTFLETLPASESTNRNSNNGIAPAYSRSNSERCVHGPTKIDLSFTNPNFLSTPESINSVLPNRSPHLYERVGRRTMIPNIRQA